MPGSACRCPYNWEQAARRRLRARQCIPLSMLLGSRAQQPASYSLCFAAPRLPSTGAERSAGYSPGCGVGGCGGTSGCEAGKCRCCGASSMAAQQLNGGHPQCGWWMEMCQTRATSPLQLRTAVLWIVPNRGHERFTTYLLHCAGPSRDGHPAHVASGFVPRAPCSRPRPAAVRSAG